MPIMQIDKEGDMVIEVIKNPISAFDSCVINTGTLEIIFNKREERLDWMPLNADWVVSRDEFHQIISLVRKAYADATRQLSFPFF